MYNLHNRRNTDHLQTPRQFGGGSTNTLRANADPDLQPVKRRRLLSPFEFEMGPEKSDTERLEEGIKRLQMEIVDSLDRQTDVLRAILEVMKDKNSK
jgi:hypothetical protein